MTKPGLFSPYAEHLEMLSGSARVDLLFCEQDSSSVLPVFVEGMYCKLILHFIKLYSERGLSFVFCTRRKAQKFFAHEFTIRTVVAAD